MESMWVPFTVDPLLSIFDDDENKSDSRLYNHALWQRADDVDRGGEREKYTEKCLNFIFISYIFIIW